MCENVNHIMQAIFWTHEFHTFAETLSVMAYLIIAFKAFRKPSMSFWLKDFRLEIALLLPSVIVAGVRIVFVNACWVQ